MPEIKCNLVAAIYIKDKSNRYFVSSTDGHYTPLSFFLNLDKDTDSLTLDDHLTNFLYDHIEKNITTSPERYAPYYNLLGVKKNGSILEINYTTILPADTKVKNAFLISPNLAVINPVARKAMAYV
jgi:hypothetical protein